MICTAQNSPGKNYHKTDRICLNTGKTIFTSSSPQYDKSTLSPALGRQKQGLTQTISKQTKKHQYSRLQSNSLAALPPMPHLAYTIKKAPDSKSRGL
jgi:hypothetical protein